MNGYLGCGEVVAGGSLLELQHRQHVVGLLDAERSPREQVERFLQRLHLCVGGPFR